MTNTNRVRACVLSLVAATIVPSVARADDVSAGGAAAPGRPDVATVRCVTGEEWACEQGQRLVLRGEELRDVGRVLFLGRPGSGDDRSARPIVASPHRVVITVPATARSGRLQIRNGIGDRTTSPRIVRVVGASAPQSVSPGPLQNAVFPIAGPHKFGENATNGFGGGRGHQGQDVFAACGTPLVAVRAGKVQTATFQARAGNYVVLQSADGQSYAYMHMRDAPLVKKGDAVAAGQPVGYVGQTGRASGCHLHFELWTAPGWYTGGHAVDPRPELTRWDAAR